VQKSFVILYMIHIHSVFDNNTIKISLSFKAVKPSTNFGA